MKIEFRRRVTYSQLAATGALVLAASGFAIAATGSSGVINACAAKRGGALRVAKKCRHTEKRVSWNRQGPAGAAGQTGQNGQPGTNGQNGQAGQNGLDGQNGAPGSARAYGRVLADGTLDTAHSKNVTGSTKVGSSEYCVAVSNATPADSVMVASPDYFEATGAEIIAPENPADACSAGQFEVETGRVHIGAALNADAGETPTAEGFVFVIP
jgi:hypothetical protein